MGGTAAVRAASSQVSLKYTLQNNLDLQRCMLITLRWEGAKRHDCGVQGQAREIYSCVHDCPKNVTANSKLLSEGMRL